MQRKFSDGLAPVDAAPQLIKDDLSKVAGAGLKPHEVRAKRKPMWVYLSSRERDAVARKAIESGEAMSEWIRNAVGKAAKC
ncbi:hypothetical protein OAG07_02045 [Verrucomicrobia bacterium]|jgi:hypothetical protein|nr:hypothetical protein [Verrucomicrobiota bacterium]MDA7670612.1 hypothetical protein [Verrucomicrobiota bacterium]MDB4642230.1 hypothetical protein [Verrucomicrobiota bacterium]